VTSSKRTIIRDSTGKPFSKWKPETKFAYYWQQNGLDGGEPETEYRFCDDRKWRMNFAWPKFRVAVEIDGFGYGHQAQQQIALDHEKQNAAVELGWKVLRFNSRSLGSHRGVQEAVDQVCRVLCGITEV